MLIASAFKTYRPTGSLTFPNSRFIKESLNIYIGHHDMNGFKSTNVELTWLTYNLYPSHIHKHLNVVHTVYLRH